MSEIAEIRVIEANKNIFDTDIKYVIPLYQRAFAWEDVHLIQLIEDILDERASEKYYIGTLIVAKQNGKYEVVDGQQRLTSLYLLLHCLGVSVKHTLTFACREKSNYTLENTEKIINALKNTEESIKDPINMDRVDQGLLNGIKILMKEVNEKGIEIVLKKLSNVIVYQVEVPENTDLNQYFEIMNTRGEQLEQHDIVKAKLMSYLNSLKDNKSNAENINQYCFAKIWDACSDMTGYVQMHFVSHRNDVRNRLFGNHWRDLPQKNWDEIKEIFRSDFEACDRTRDRKCSDKAGGPCISDIIKSDCVEDEDEYNEKGERVRFKSIIDFPFFLLHTLEIFVKINKITYESSAEKLLDDKKLIKRFELVFEQGRTNFGYVKDNKAAFAKEFILCLLRTRFLFDKYIIKREYVNDQNDGEWSLKSLDTSGQQSNKKPYYSNTYFKKDAHKTNLMIQSALRVSYTSPKIMHWITQLLQWLSEKDYVHYNQDLFEFATIAEKIAKEAVKENFFGKCSYGRYEMGVNTPHIVFNYLDFLLWKNQQKKYEDFVFEFRNSVEHWYPRNPSEGMFDRWENASDSVDRFGNLCIVQRKVNSRFSNLSPGSKKDSFLDDIKKGSLKLRKMSAVTKNDNGMDAARYWRETACKQHEKEMINILKTACEIIE